MKLTRREGLKILGATAALATPLKALAESHGGTVVEMLNKSPDGSERQVFEPPVLQVEPGTTVSFVSTDRGHNSESNKQMMPEGAEVWKSKIGKDVDVTFDVPGVYG